MASYSERRRTFQGLLEGAADLAFIPLTTDLDYLAGVRRDIPHFGRILHPGGWLEGAWFGVHGERPILTLPRMSAELDNRAQGNEGLDVRVLGERDDPAQLARAILDELRLPPAPRVAVSDDTEATALIELQKLLPDARFVSATGILRKLRTIKDADELALMRAAGKLTEDALHAALPQFRLAMTELDVIAELDYQMKRLGSLGPSFTTTLYCSGPNHPRLPGQRLASWKRALTPPVSVLLDFGAVGDGPVYDYGRTVSFGSPSAEQVRVHRVIMESQAAGIAALRAGNATCEMVDKAARDVVEAAGYGETFRHRLGHSIGWDVHEPPFLTRGDQTNLQEGMVFTIEPSIVQDRNFSARVEDCIIARPAGGEPMTTGFQDLLVVE